MVWTIRTSLSVDALDLGGLKCRILDIAASSDSRRRLHVSLSLGSARLSVCLGSVPIKHRMVLATSILFES